MAGNDGTWDAPNNLSSPHMRDVIEEEQYN